MGIWAKMNENYLYLGFDSSFSSIFQKGKNIEIIKSLKLDLLPFPFILCAGCEGFYYSGNAVENKYFIITDFGSPYKAFAFLIFSVFMSSSFLFIFNLRLKL